MPTTIREAAEELLLSNRTNGDVDNFITDVSKLILEADVMKDEEVRTDWHGFDDEICRSKARNNLRAEIREALRKIGVE